MMEITIKIYALEKKSKVFYTLTRIVLFSTDFSLLVGRERFRTMKNYVYINYRVSN